MVHDLDVQAAEYEALLRDQIIARRRGPEPSEVATARRIVAEYEASFAKDEEVGPRLGQAVPQGFCWRCFYREGKNIRLTPISPPAGANQRHDFYRCRECHLEIEAAT